jgi:large subunit ribosomal protein L55
LPNKIFNFPFIFRTVVVNPDGSTFMIRYHEPRAIITLPFDLSTLSEADRKARLEKRKPKRKVKIEAEVDDQFNANKYLKYMKKK